MASPAKKQLANPGLAQALKRPENKACADCGVRGASWASVNLGIFVCMECSAIHRKIGVHISVVKSSTLDTWQAKWIETCSKVGNRIGNDYYEHRLPANFPRPGQRGGTSLSMEEWIRAKYERRDYAASSRGKKCPPPGELVQDGRNPDVYSRQEDDVPQSSGPSGESTERPNSSSSGGSQPSAQQAPVCPGVDSTGWATFASEEDATTKLLTEYYDRVGQAKTKEQLAVIVERYKGREDELFAQLEKKYGQPVRKVPGTPSTTCPSPESGVAQAIPAPQTVVATAVLIPDVFAVEAEAVQRQQQAMQCQQATQDQQINCLKHNLSALYQQSAQPQPVLASNGSNYSDLISMQPSPDAQQQLAAMQQMQQMAMQQQMATQQMQQYAAMQQMQQMAAQAQFSGMTMGYGGQ